MPDEDEVDGLTPGLALAWGVRSRPKPGRRPGLDLEQIVGAGIVVADADGLPAVSMGKVAAELGFTTMSLYRYVESKDELLRLMFDAALGPAPDPAPEGSWRERLDAWATGILLAYRRHPWASMIPILGPPITPFQVGWMDQGLAATEGTRLLPNERASVILLLSGYVRNVAQLEGDLAGGGEFGEGDTGAMGRWTHTVSRLTAGRTPALAEVIAAGVFDRPDPPDAEYRFGLDRILDGIDALIRRRAAAH